jgi:predicted O-methyltransferase YrrM
VIVVDNVVRGGAVLDGDSDDPAVAGTRRLFDAVAAEPEVSATAVQTVGSKGHDGFLLAVVNT